MDGWSADPVPVHFVQGTTPLERQGAIVFQEKQCRNCHQVGGLGGRRGPSLDDVATRLTEDQLVRQVIQGGGNMPAYGKTLSPATGNSVGIFFGDAASCESAGGHRCVAARGGDEQPRAEGAGGGSPSLATAPPFGVCSES